MWARMAALVASWTIAFLALAPGDAGSRATRPWLAGLPYVTVHLVDQAHIGSRPLQTVERALRTQFDDDVDREWHVGRLRFAPDGWTVTIEAAGHLDGDDDGMHGVGPGGRPYAVVADSYDWTVALSHELIELLSDPYLHRQLYGQLVEICDPVETVSYRVRGIAVSDFVKPAWFRAAVRQRAYLAWIPS